MEEPKSLCSLAIAKSCPKFCLLVGVCFKCFLKIFISCFSAPSGICRTEKYAANSLHFEVSSFFAEQNRDLSAATWIFGCSPFQRQNAFKTFLKKKEAAQQTAYLWSNDVHFWFSFSWWFCDFSERRKYELVHQKWSFAWLDKFAC